MCGMVGYIDMYQPKCEASVFIANGNLEISTVILQEFRFMFPAELPVL